MTREGLALLFIAGAFGGVVGYVLAQVHRRRRSRTRYVSKLRAHLGEKLTDAGLVASASVTWRLPEAAVARDLDSLERLCRDARRLGAPDGAQVAPESYSERGSITVRWEL